MADPKCLIIGIVFAILLFIVIRFKINLKSAKQASIKTSPKLLRIAKVVR